MNINKLHFPVTFILHAFNTTGATCGAGTA